MTDHIDQRMGNYRLIRLIGQGGFADVYLGQHIHLQRQAAIKVLKLHLASGATAQFLNEARTVANLIHPHIVRVLEFGIEENTPFLVMEYATSGNMRQHYPQDTMLSPHLLISFIKQVASALQYAHDQNLIHRDVKPENMLLSQDGSILLSDFGIAQVARTTNFRSSSSHGMQEAAGTVTYMAPEQILGKPSYASDQYALGIVTYEWLCGTPPFTGSAFELYGQHLHAPVSSLQEKLPSIPDAVEHVVLTALAKEPAQRFPSIQAFANALEAAFPSSMLVADSGSTVIKTPLPSAPSGTTLTHISPYFNATHNKSATETSATYIKSSSNSGITSISPVSSDNQPTLEKTPATSFQQLSRPETPPVPLDMANSASSSTPEMAPLPLIEGDESLVATQVSTVPTTRLKRSSLVTITAAALVFIVIATTLIGVSSWFHPSQSLQANNFPTATTQATNQPTQAQSQTTATITATTQSNNATATAPSAVTATSAAITQSSNATATISPVATVNLSGTAQANSTATTVAQANLVTATAQAAANVLAAGTSSSPDYLFLDPNANWDNGGTICVLSSTNNSYHIQSNAGYHQPCREYGYKNYTNFTITAHLVINSGTGGLLFRVQNLGNAAGYYFEIHTDGSYDMADFEGDTIIYKAISSAINTGTGASNILQLVAKGSDYYFYVNGTFLTHIANTLYSSSSGAIGLACYGTGCNADVSGIQVYNN